VSNRDKQLDDELEQTLGSLDIPPHDGEAKRRAIAMARAEFETLQQEKKEQKVSGSQGLFGWLRLIVTSQADNRSAIMTFNRTFIYSGITAVAVGAIAVGISLQNQPYSDIPGDRVESELEFARLEEAVASHAHARLQSGEPGDSPARFRDKLELLEENKEHINQAAEVAVLEDRMITAHKSSRSVAGTVDAVNMASPQAAVTIQLAAQAGNDVLPSPYHQDEGRDNFEAFEQNGVLLVSEVPVSTFSADVDTASYSFVRRMLNSGVLPAGDAVRAEELINYFDYDYPLPASKALPFQPTVAVSDAPWAEGRKLMHIGIKGYDIAPEATPRSNLVFLLDVSGSMNSPDKLPLVKQSMELLLTTLNPDDTVAIAVYAGAAGVILEPTPVKEKQKILNAMHQLGAGGSTAGAQGIRLAYELARSGFDKNAVNRVILATDGDFNVGITSERELQSFIERKREEGIFLSVLGFGQGNYQDALMQTLAQNGNGVAAYIDTLSEAQKVLVAEATSSLFPIAKDVKLQVEFNPATVAEYRLIGYETRHLNREDFNNDAVDAGDIGAGHTMTAIYEFTPVGSSARQIEEGRYVQKGQELTGNGSEYAFLKIRYKLPEEDTSRLITQPISRENIIELGGEGIGHEAGFATAVAGFAQLLKGGKYTAEYDYDDVIKLAQHTRGSDPFGYRTEFIQLVRKAKTAEALRRR
jgi:Ca-activated chloride channel family protein